MSTAKIIAWDIPDQQPTTMRAVIPRADIHPDIQLLQFQIANPTRPSNYGIRGDTRQLGLFLTSIQLQPAAP